MSLDQKTLYDANGKRILFSADGHVISVGPHADGAALTKNPLVIAGKSPTGTVKPVLVDANGNTILVGPAAEDAAISGNPVLLGGESPTGTLKPVQVDADGKLRLSATITGSNNVQDDSDNTDKQAKGDDDGVQFVRNQGQKPVEEDNIPLALQITTIATAKQLSDLDYLAKEIILTPNYLNTDAETLFGDVAAQYNSIAKGISFRIKGPTKLSNWYGKAHTTTGDKLNILAQLVDRPDYRRMLLKAIRANGGAYWPFTERSGTALVDRAWGAKAPYDLLLTSATLGQAGIFDFGIDFDATGDYLRQKSEAVNSGTVTPSGAAAYTLDDTGAVFTAAIRDGAHFVVMKDAAGETAMAYIGTSDVDADSTKVELYTTTGRTVLGYAHTQAGFSEADTPITFTVHKELHTLGSHTMGLWLDVDAFASEQHLLGFRGSGRVISSLRITTDPYLDFTIANDAQTLFRATDGRVPRTGQAVLVTATFEASTRVTLYVDGVQIAENTTSIPAAVAEAAQPLSIGADGTLTTTVRLLDGRVSHPFYIRAAMADNWHKSLFEAGRR